MTRARSTEGLNLLVREPRAEAAEWRHFWATKDADARAALFVRFREFARKTAIRKFYRIQDMGLDQTDCEQLGYEALLQSIERFEPGRGTPFTAFARPRIRGAINNALAKANEARAAYHARNRAERDRLNSVKRPANQNANGDTIEALREIVAGMALGFMLEDNAETEAHQVPSDAPSAYESVAWIQALGAMEDRLETLPDQEMKVIEYHYKQGLLFAQIATLLGVSRSRISQIHSSAINRLRKSLAKFQ